MLSKSSKYAVRTVLHLALKEDGRKYGSKEMANTLNIPAPFLAKILQSLTKANIISSVRGPNGGFYLTAKDKQNVILDIVACIDGLEKFNECFLGHPECSDLKPCVVHHVVAPFKKEFLKTLSEKTILNFSNEIKNNIDSGLSSIISA